jgi:hypothetical protein
MIQPHKGDPCELCGLPSGVTDNEECLGALVEQIRDIETDNRAILSKLGYFRERAKVAARIYSDLTDTSGEVLSIEGAFVKVALPKKPRVTWNAKGLQEYSSDHPDVLQFRSEKWSEPSVTVKVDKSYSR